jgi:hypothetical protein
MRLPPGTRSTVAPAAWFAALSLTVAGPLLGGGYLLLLDWPSGPRFPEVEFLPSATSGGIANTAPLNALHAWLRSLHLYLPDKLFLVAPILLGGFGIYRFVRSRLEVGPMGAILGGTLFMVNPWVIDRYLSGHLHLLLAYSLLPWALFHLFDGMQEPSLARALWSGAWLVALGMIDLHIAGMYALLAVVALLAAPSPRRVLYTVGALSLATVLSAWWLGPALVSPPALEVGPGDLAAYASRPRGYEVLPTLAAMYGFWRNEFVGPAGRIAGLQLLLIPMLSLAAIGLFRLLRRDGAKRFSVVIAMTAGLALLLAGGTSFPPTAGVFRWLFDNILAVRIYREPQKFLALVVLAYALFAAVGLHALLAGRAAWIARTAFGAAVAAVLTYGYTLLGGFWGQVHLSHYPRDWYTAQRVISKGTEDGRLLVFPWHLYAVWSFSDGRIVANPASSFFAGDVLINPEAGFPYMPAQADDATVQYVADLLEERPGDRFGHRLASVDVRYVALLREVNYWDYRFLRRQRDLDLLYEGTHLAIFRNMAWEP